MLGHGACSQKICCGDARLSAPSELALTILSKGLLSLVGSMYSKLVHMCSSIPVEALFLICHYHND